MRDRLKELFKANAKAGKPLNVVLAKDKDEATVYLYDVIGDDFWGGISAKAFVAQLAGITAKTIHLRIDSPGGDVFMARAMQTNLAQHKSKVVAHIDGIAASAATFLLMAADEVEIAEGAMFMIHDAWGLTIGNKNDMLAMAEMLEKIDGTISKDYQRKTGLFAEEIAAMMDAETWMTAEEALDKGFVDSIYKPEKASDMSRWDLSAYDNPPEIYPAPAADGPQDEIKPPMSQGDLERRLKLMEMAA